MSQTLTEQEATDFRQKCVNFMEEHAAGQGRSLPGLDDQKAFLVNLKGLWNVLESARQRGIERVVHIGSCMTVHPKGIFFSAEIRSTEGDLYGICKRLQEEMCRQFHDASGMKTIVLRPDYIVDSRLGIGRHREELKGKYRGLFSYRFSDYRIVYEIKKKQLVIYILRIRHRKNIYNGL